VAGFAGGLREAVMNTNPKFPKLCSLAKPAAALVALAVLVPAKASPDSFTGLSSVRARFGVEPTEQGFLPAANDYFGLVHATGDFNSDGADDLVTGIPYDDCTAAIVNCGAAVVRWGFPGYGLTSSVLFLSQSTPGSPNPPVADDLFGRALAVGDFNGDGRDDLAIGQPRLDSSDPGGVEIHYGLPGGIQWAGEHFLRPGVDGLPAPGAEFTTRFGWSLASGDFDGDGFDDLAIGYLYDRDELEEGMVEGGSVTVAHGGAGGLMPFSGYRVAQHEPGIPDAPENGDRFGFALGSGDWNGDGFDDLVIGAPGEDGTGAMLVLFGSPNSLIFANHYWLGEFDLGTVGNLDDNFGSSFASGDFDRDGFDDLVIGSPGRDNVNGDNAIGMITALYGAPGSPATGGGFDFAARQFLWEDVVGGQSSAEDRFGSALAAGDFGGDGYDDLAIGTPYNVATQDDEGLVTVLTGGANRLFSRFDALLPGYHGIPGTSPHQGGLHFGSSLATGDFVGNGFADLAIGMPYYNGAEVDQGAEAILYGSLFSDGFETGGTGFWSATVD
jgi:hypothetical protein